MRKTIVLLFALMSMPVLAEAPIPRFDTPQALLQAVYDQIEASEDWETFDYEAAFSERDAFSARLSGLLDEANAKFYATGEEIGALDFSPFIYGQDSGGMDFSLGNAKIKGDAAVITVSITLEGEAWCDLTFYLVDDGEAGWKVDDILLPLEDAAGTWKLSEYLADPALP